MEVRFCYSIIIIEVFTDLLLNDSTPELRKFPFGVLAAQPEEVGEDLAPKLGLGITNPDQDPNPNPNPNPSPDSNPRWARTSFPRSSPSP